YENKERLYDDDEGYRRFERDMMLSTIDEKWIDYLTTMEHFREGITLQAWGQKDPLVEYKHEAYTMFNELTESIRAGIVTRVFHLQPVRPDQMQPPTPARADGRGPNGHGPNGRGAVGEPVGAASSPGKIGRNDP